MNSRRGLFLVLEGIDGCGKTTIAKSLARWFKKNGRRVILTQEPTEGEFGKKIRDLLAGREKMIAPLALQRLYVLDRRDHLEKLIRPELRAGRIVISQRYALSTFAYGIASGQSFQTLFKLHRQLLGDGFILPDATFLLDLPADIAMQRIHKRGRSVEYFEKEAKLNKIRNQYLGLARQKRLGLILVVDARPKQNNIFETIRKQTRLLMEKDEK